MSELHKSDAHHDRDPDHRHEHGESDHSHHHGPPRSQGQLFWALLLTGGCMVIEAAGGWIAKILRAYMAFDPPQTEYLRPSKSGKSGLGRDSQHFASQREKCVPRPISHFPGRTRSHPARTHEGRANSD